jgi:hypothetical protein
VESGSSTLLLGLVAILAVSVLVFRQSMRT